MQFLLHELASDRPKSVVPGPSGWLTTSRTPVPIDRESNGDGSFQAPHRGTLVHQRTRQMLGGLGQRGFGTIGPGGLIGSRSSFACVGNIALVDRWEYRSIGDAIGGRIGGRMGPA